MSAHHAGGGKKLANSDVAAIRRRWTFGSHLTRTQRLADFARDYEVCVRTIERVLARDTYKDVT